MATVPRTRTFSPQRLVLTGVSWQEYGKFLRAFEGRRAVRLTYDRGVLEIMSPRHEHETDVDFLGRLAVTLTEEMGLSIKAGGSTTFRRRKKRRGLEPDRCYWIASEPLVRGKRDINLRKDPPPDLAIEVDVTSSSLDRMAIYASLSIPEVWRMDDAGLTFHVLGPDGKYAPSPRSKSFPLVAPADLTRFLAMRAQLDENAVVQQFRVWFRQQAAGAAAAQP
jgi:Uma2 family endonuclease